MNPSVAWNVILKAFEGGSTGFLLQFHSHLCQWDFQGPPIMGQPYGKLPILFPYHSHFRIAKDMGIAWVPLTIRESHYWGSLESPSSLEGSLNG